MTLSSGAWGALAAALIAYVISWVASFLVRLFNAPVELYHEQKDRADKLEGLRQIASDLSRPPSFDLGFDFLPFNPEEFHYRERRHPLCRIWVENLEHIAIEDCRVVIENMKPHAGIHNGALLLPDERTEGTQVGVFRLAATQKQYFKFLEIQKSIDTYFSDNPSWELTIRSDQEPSGVTGILNRHQLEFQERYFVTIAAHGRDAASRRINLSIDLHSPTNIVVVETSAETHNDQPKETKVTL